MNSFDITIVEEWANKILTDIKFRREWRIRRQLRLRMVKINRRRRRLSRLTLGLYPFKPATRQDAHIDRWDLGFIKTDSWEIEAECLCLLKLCEDLRAQGKSQVNLNSKQYKAVRTPIRKVL